MISYEIKPEGYMVAVDLQMTDGHDVVREYHETFADPVKAQKYVASKLEQYLRLRVVNYITHSRNIQKNSEHPYYKTPEFRKAMHNLIGYMTEINEKNLHSIARFVNEHDEELRLILPAQGNFSYTSSKAKLDSILILVRKLQTRQNRVF